MKDLPEKKAGMFFKEAARPDKGRFFRELGGREDGMFMGKSAQAGMVAQTANAPAAAARAQQSAQVNIGATGAPMGGSGFGGAGMGGGMYGTGKGMGKEIDTRKDGPRKREIGGRTNLDIGTGADQIGTKGLRGRSPIQQVIDKKIEHSKPIGRAITMEKASAASPTDWNIDAGMPTGFHRPSHIQPESLESGGERFHATEANSVVPATNRQRHGLVEGGRMTVRPTSSPQMGKQAAAAPGYYASPPPKPANNAGDWLSQRGSEYVKSMKGLVSGGQRDVKAGIGKLDELARSITQSSAGSALATLGMLALGGRGLRRFGGALKRKPPPVPPSKNLFDQIKGFITR